MLSLLVLLLWFPCPGQSTLMCMITYKSLYKIPRPYCLEDEVIVMTSLSGLFRTSLCDVIVLLFRMS
jgi:hypothetical protein